MRRLRHFLWWQRRRLSDFVRYKIIYRTNRTLKSYIGVALITGGTDCDGMRWAVCDYYWTRKAAEHALEQSYLWADGPMSAEVTTARDGRVWEEQHEPDTRDRFAERMGY